MSISHLPQEATGRTPQSTGLCLFPKMERPSQWNQLVVPLGDGWESTMLKVLKPTRIPEAADPRRASRKTKQGLLGAKSCAPGVTPYLLGQGGSRGKRDATRHDRWTWLPIDLDAVPVAVGLLGEIVRVALGDWKHVSWTTWSCKDGYASMRVLVPLAREVKLAELIPIWWWARRRLLDAGLPPESAKAGEPANDSRALDARLFYLPAAPTPMVVGTEGWGGVVPSGYVSPDEVPVLDPDDVVEVGRRVQAEDEQEHVVRWPSVPVPSAGPTTRTEARASAGRRGPGGGNGPSEAVDFSAIVMFGEVEGELRAWAARHLPQPGTEVSIGRSVFDPTIWGHGDRATAYQTCRLHRDERGQLWAHDFRTGITYFDTDGVELDDLDLDIDERVDALLGVAEPDELALISDLLVPSEVPSPLMRVLRRTETVEGALMGGVVHPQLEDLRLVEDADAVEQVVPTQHFLDVADLMAMLDGNIREDVGANHAMDENPPHSLTRKGGKERLCGGNSEKVQEARSRLVDTRAYCPRAPTDHHERPSGLIRSTRTACLTYSCSRCGPRLLAVLAASIRIYIEDHWNGWYGSLVVVKREHRKIADALRAWQRASPDARGYIGVARTPREIAYLVAWNTDANTPVGALSRHLVFHKAQVIERPVHLAVDALCEGIDPGKWAKGKRVEVLRGPDAITNAIADLRDQVLGRSRARRNIDIPTLAPTLTRFRSYRTAAEIRKVVSDATQSDTVTAHVDYDARSRAVIVEWGSEEKGLRLGSVLDRLVQSGEIATVGTYTPPVADLRAEAALRRARRAGQVEALEVDDHLELEKAKVEGSRVCER